MKRRDLMSCAFFLCRGRGRTLSGSAAWEQSWHRALGFGFLEVSRCFVLSACSAVINSVPPSCLWGLNPPNLKALTSTKPALALLPCLILLLAPHDLKAAAATTAGYTRAEFLATNEIRVPFTPAVEIRKWLEARALQEAKAAAKLSAFHNFRFEDRTAESGITFKHNVVDDAGKTFKAAHYDHGTGLAVADVDGDGLLDIYFVNQKGGNELWRNLGRGKFENITSKAGV